MEKAFKFRIYPNKAQQILLQKHLDVQGLYTIIFLLKELKSTRKINLI